MRRSFPAAPIGFRPRSEPSPKASEFPRLADLESDRLRGQVLHFFANHELLALEIMALTLLRFPDAHPAFRREVAATLRDEQLHFRLYRDRMLELGVDPGSLPPSRYLWDQTASMRSPFDYVTDLSLTFEQANLDFSLAFRDAFSRVGDTHSAELMTRVYEDEIRHVRRGLGWFDRWRDRDLTRWESFRAAQRPPLGPGHAKGRTFSREARVRAGLDPAFIDELEVFSSSRGRPPRVFHFNPDCEGEILLGRRPEPPPRAVEILATDLDCIFAAVARAEDLVLVRERPRAAFLATLKAAGVDLPEFAVCDPSIAQTAMDAIGAPLVGGLEPWGWSPASAALLDPLRSRMSAAQDGSVVSGWKPERRRLHGKTLAAELLGRFLEGAGAELVEAGFLGGIDSCGRSCAAVEEVIRALADLPAPAVIKAELGASGRNAIRVRDRELSAEQKTWVVRTLRSHGAVVVEPWLDRVLDFSFQLEIQSADRIRLLGVTRFSADRGGRFLGAWTGPATRGLDARLQRFLDGSGDETRGLRALGAILTREIGRNLVDLGHRGPAGIDALVYRERSAEGAAEVLRIRPLVDLNPRWTMGRLALELGRLVRRGVPAFWLHLRRREVVDTGFADFRALAVELEERCPPRPCQGVGFRPPRFRSRLHDRPSARGRTVDGAAHRARHQRRGRATARPCRPQSRSGIVTSRRPPSRSRSACPSNSPASERSSNR